MSVETITLSQLIRGFIPGIDLSTTEKAIIAIEACIFLIESKAIPESPETVGFMQWVVGYWRKVGPGAQPDEPDRLPPGWTNHEKNPKLH